jgi:hypothetical protein
MFIRNCKNCPNEFSVKHKSSKKKCCGIECANRNNGGARIGSGHAKTGYYKGVYCGSTYELAWVIYQIDHEKEFKRFEGFVEYEGKKYFPDFFQDNKIIEIKGFENKEKVALKTRIAEQNGYEVTVLRKEDLTSEFAWVHSKYQSNNLFELYDSHTPKFIHICSFCLSNFDYEKRKKTEKVYCSRSCCLKANRQSPGKNEFS